MGLLGKSAAGKKKAAAVKKGHRSSPGKEISAKGKANAVGNGQGPGLTAGSKQKQQQSSSALAEGKPARKKLKKEHKMTGVQ